MAVKLSALCTDQLAFSPRKIPGAHFCQRPSRTQGHSAAGSMRSIEKSNNLIQNWSCDLPACSMLPQPTTLCLYRTKSGDMPVRVTSVTSHLAQAKQNEREQRGVWPSGLQCRVVQKEPSILEADTLNIHLRGYWLTLMELPLYLQYFY
jgi:hypothetical protein